jgi:tagatose-6-phosphate ketose/aldose isomerase
VAPILQAELGVPVKAVGGGDLLTHPRNAALPGRPLLVVSLARSGNSPESTGVSEHFFEHEPLCRQLFITCNAQGSLALRHASDSRAHSLVLDDRTNDRSLVMTSSFTSMVLAGRFLGCLDRAEPYRDAIIRLSHAARRLILEHTDKLAAAAHDDFRYALYLGAGCRFGAAREAGLKMMEMSAGCVRTMAETYMGLRHGPMAAIGDDTLIVCFLSSEPLARAYETDLLRELVRKKVGRRKIVMGESVPAELLREGDIAVDCPDASGLGDDKVTVLDVLAGQLLAFFHCLSVGLRPDAPSPGGVISRVVESFRLYRPAEIASRDLG